MSRLIGWGLPTLALLAAVAAPRPDRPRLGDAPAPTPAPNTPDNPVPPPVVDPDGDPTQVGLYVPSVRANLPLPPPDAGSWVTRRRVKVLVDGVVLHDDIQPIDDPQPAWEAKSGQRFEVWDYWVNAQGQQGDGTAASIIVPTMPPAPKPQDFDLDVDWSWKQVDPPPPPGP